MAFIWTHTTVTGNENGVGWCTATTRVGAWNAMAGGGYACLPTSGSGSETDGSSAQGLLPLVAIIPVFDSSLAAWGYKVGFALAHSATAEAHVWVSGS